MGLQFDKCIEYRWQRDTTSFGPKSVDTLEIVNSADALGHSTLVVSPTTDDRFTFNSDNWQIASLVVLMLCFYCYVIFRFSRPIRMIFKNALSIDATVAMLDNPSRDFNKFMPIAKSLLLFILSIIVLVAVKQNQTLPPGLSIVLILAIVIVVSIISMLRVLFRKIAGQITDTEKFFYSISLIEACSISLIATIVTPLAITLPFFPPIFDIAIYTLVIIYLYYLLRLYLTIRGKKFSFMQWFLYLCGVEIAPIAIVVATIVLINTIVLR